MVSSVVFLSQYQFSFGTLHLASSERGLCAVAFPREAAGMRRWLTRRFDQGDFGSLPETSEVLREAVAQLRAYFAGELRRFTLPLDLIGTEFQQKVWRAVQRVPYGETCAYGEVARRIGHPQAARAVGAANGANPLPIIIPCHRVVGADGGLVKYGGGVEMKRKLLDLEMVSVP